MRIKRDWFTDELVEVPTELEDGSTILRYGEVTRETRFGSTTSRTHVSRAAAVNPEQAERFTEAAKKAGIPVEYDRKTGNLLSDSRSAYRAEARRRGFYPNN